MGVSKEYASRLELSQLIAWIMKDFAWVLLLAPLCWPAALAAICLEFHSTMLGWKIDTKVARGHGLACLVWITGNAIWMSSEILWESEVDKAGVSIFPWRSGPLAGEGKQAYQIGVWVARGFFILALLVLSAVYMAAGFEYWSSGGRSVESATAGSSNPQDETDVPVEAVPTEPLAWGIMTPQVYLGLFIGPWIVKDVFWTLKLLWPALIFAVLAFIIMADGFRRYASPVSLIEMNWVIGNAIWIYAEIGLAEESLAARVVAASFLALGCALAVRALPKVSESAQGGRILGATESTPIIGASAAASSHEA